MSDDRITELPRPPIRPDDAHKGTFGRAMIVGGSVGMSGAVCLAGLGALRSGAGLVYLAIPRSLAATVASVEPSYLTIPLPEDTEGRLCLAGYQPLLEAIPRNTGIAIGPGWGQSEDLTRIATSLYESVEQPMVVDADGLNALAHKPDRLASHAGSRILTPHPGEFARLTGMSAAKIQSNRVEVATDFATTHQVVLLLKGHRTVISDGVRLAINETGNSGMATGGSGDVLTGLIVGLVAQGMTAFDAAVLAAHLHGRAGDIAAAELSELALIASDLPRYLGAAWKELTEPSAG